MEEAAGVGQKIPRIKKPLFKLSGQEMEQDRAEIRIFFCSEVYLPLGYAGWRHQVGHHRNVAACGMSQRRKTSSACSSGGCVCHQA